MTTLHLVRNEPPPPALVAERDWIVYLQPTPRIAVGPQSPRSLDHDQLVALCFTADRIITW